MALQYQTGCAARSETQRQGSQDPDNGIHRLLAGDCAAIANHDLINSRLQINFTHVDIHVGSFIAFVSGTLLLEIAKQWLWN